MKALLSLLLFPAVLASCSTPRQAADDNFGACRPAGIPAVHFYASKKFGSTPGQSLPGKYVAYEASESEWKAFAQKVKERGPKEVTGLAIPLPAGCKTFSVTVSQTMSPELALKYPDIISLKGTTDDGSDLRLDWNGKEMRGQVVSGSDTYFLEPVVFNGKMHCLIYHKNDAPATKQAFE